MPTVKVYNVGTHFKALKKFYNESHLLFHAHKSWLSISLYLICVECETEMMGFRIILHTVYICGGIDSNGVKNLTCF